MHDLLHQMLQPSSWDRDGHHQPHRHLHDLHRHPHPRPPPWGREMFVIQWLIENYKNKTMSPCQ